MRKTKKKRLEAKGWKVGTAAEFLGLSPDESASVEARLRLGQRPRGRGITRPEIERRCAALDAGTATTTDWPEARRRIEAAIQRKSRRAARNGRRPPAP
jgi:hypothetical protein